jgi:hypothetical protein
MTKNNFMVTGGQNMTVDLSHYSAGMYFFSLANNDQPLQTLKVIKQ